MIKQCTSSSIYSEKYAYFHDVICYEPIVKFVSYLITISHFGTKIDESEIQNHEISLVQRFYIGTKIKLDPDSELGSFDLGSGKMLVQLGIKHVRGRGGVVVGLLAFHQDEPVSNPGGFAPGFSHVGIMPDDASDRRVFSGISRFPALPFRRCSILISLHPHRLSRPRYSETPKSLHSICLIIYFFFYHFYSCTASFGHVLILPKTKWPTTNIDDDLTGKGKEWHAQAVASSYPCHVGVASLAFALTMVAGADTPVRCYRIAGGRCCYITRSPLRNNVARQRVLLRTAGAVPRNPRATLHHYERNTLPGAPTATMTSCCRSSRASHQGKPGSIPGRVTEFSHVGIVPDNAFGRRVFSGISRFPPLIGSQDLAVAQPDCLNSKRSGADFYLQTCNRAPSFTKRKACAGTKALTAHHDACSADMHVAVTMIYTARRRILEILATVGTILEQGQSINKQCAAGELEYAYVVSIARIQQYTAPKLPRPHLYLRVQDHSACIGLCTRLLQDFFRQYDIRKAACTSRIADRPSGAATSLSGIEALARKGSIAVIIFPFTGPSSGVSFGNRRDTNNNGNNGRKKDKNEGGGGELLDFCIAHVHRHAKNHELVVWYGLPLVSRGTFDGPPRVTSNWRDFSSANAWEVLHCTTPPPLDALIK
ncbi:hypothetical protein PR048_008260 [Dryococelus australis]|uniref:Uncharacterized protein n=1 Tax=Dryococelus australis TaxID=614101 RepID=A0ABQ9HWL7_9NEOP|nr:hypothetical protein PR048_008260 [Dryococelus australis]